MDLEKYEKIFKGGKERVKVNGLCGRILHGRKPKDFETLTCNPNRLVIMLIGSDGLEYLLVKNGYESLIHIGYTKDYIKYKIDQGNKFKLVVFKENNSILLATWDNVAKLCSKIYPNVSDKIYAVLDQLKTIPFQRIQMLADYDFEEIKRNGLHDPNFMNYELFRKSEGTLINVRAFLYHTLHFRMLFSGDGYTYDEDGNRGLREYIAPNKRLNELGEYRLIDIKIEI